MDKLIGGLFGGNDDNNDRQTKAQDFISRYDQGAVDEGYDENEAFEHFQQVSQHADPDTMQRASEQAFNRMDPDQRTQFAQYLQQQGGGGNLQGRMSSDPREMAGMVSQMQRQNPGGLGALFGGGNSGNSGGGGIGDALGGLLGGGGGGGFPGGSMGKVALGGIAAFAMKEMLGGGNDDDKKRKRSI